MLPDDSGVRFESTLDLVRRFAVPISWQNAHDPKRRQAQAGAELQLEEFWAGEMKKDVVAGPVSRHERTTPAPGFRFLLVAGVLSRRA
jgi:hypothetical protein